ncbi:MAG: hypothetical protein K2I26_03895 [Paramuribaculum sp.]|nr:hypothetical protein [Paramuribaculum sp.]
MTALRSICLTILLSLTAIMLLPAGLSAQRRITPVEPAPGTKGTPAKESPSSPSDDPSRLKEARDDKGNIIFIDTVSGQEWIDTTAVKESKKMIYPKIYCAAAGLNIWDTALRLAGQKYGIISAWGELNIHNRYFPTFELGLGQASITPEESNFTFRSPLAPFFKIGASYNVFYNSDPRYKFLVGFRYGFTPFSYRITDITLSDPYWGITSEFDIPRQTATAGYLEFLAGVRVNIVSNFSIGWDLRFHTVVHESKSPYGKPMYIPGYGKRGAAITGTLSLVYTFELNHPAPNEVINSNDKK